MTFSLATTGVMTFDLGDGAWTKIWRGFIPVTKDYMNRYLRLGYLKQESIRIRGQERPMPRLTAYHSLTNLSYAYSGKSFAPYKWHSTLTEIDEEVCRATGYAAFNSVVVNLYRGGQDSIAWHSDDEPELGPSRTNILVASVTLGATRRFLLRNKRSNVVVGQELGDGDILLMGGTTQTHWQHCVPKTTKKVGPRLNFTFRVINPSVGVDKK